jgi:hypothetical protein
MSGRRLLAALLVGAVVLVLSSGAAHGAKPEKFPVEVFDPADVVVDEFLSEACGTAVSFSAKGHFFGQAFFLKDGGIRLAFHPSFRQTLTSAYGTLETSDVGVDKISFNEDGTVTVFGTDIHLKVKGEAYAIGLWRLTLDGTTFDLIDQEYHGKFDLLAPEIDAYICSVLGPPA